MRESAEEKAEGAILLLARAGNGESFASLKFKSSENAPWEQVEKERGVAEGRGKGRGGKENTERNEDALVTFGWEHKVPLLRRIREDDVNAIRNSLQ